MAYRHDNREFEINEEQVADFLQNAVERVRTSEDVDVLASLSKLFKKNVSLTVRKYVIALMLKESLKHYRYFGNNRRTNEKFGRTDRTERNDRRDNNRTEYKASYRQEKTDDAVSAEGIAPVFYLHKGTAALGRQNAPEVVIIILLGYGRPYMVRLMGKRFTL